MSPSVNIASSEHKTDKSNKNHLESPKEPRRPLIVQIVPIKNKKTQSTAHNTENTCRSPQRIDIRLNSHTKSITNNSGNQEQNRHFFGSEKNFKITRPNQYHDRIHQYMSKVEV